MRPMKKPLMKLVAKTFLTWLAKKLPSGGKPYLHNLEAEFIIVIDAMPDGIGPSFDESVKLTETAIKDIIDWVLKAVRDSHMGEPFVALLTYVIGILEGQAISEIMELMSLPPSITDPRSVPKNVKVDSLSKTK